VVQTKVFVSYSRHDESLVRPLAGLLGVAADDAVFLDVASVKPGDKWQDGIERALKESSVFILCWCCEAARSKFIGHEIAVAMEGNGKRLVPVLFCDTPLPATLASYQWIDLRGHITHTCSHSVPAAPIVNVPSDPIFSPTRGRKIIFLVSGVAGVIVVASISLVFLATKSAPPVAATKSEEPNQKTSSLPPPVAVATADASHTSQSPLVVVNREVRLSVRDGSKCLVMPGDMLRVESPTSGDRPYATATIVLSRTSSGCQTGTTVDVSDADLQEMQFSSSVGPGGAASGAGGKSVGTNASAILVFIAVLMLALGVLAARRIKRGRIDAVADAARTYFNDLRKPTY
jgi:hypothetical protein